LLTYLTSEMFEWYRQQCIELLSMLIQAGQWRELVLVREKNNIASRQYRSIIIIIVVVDFSIVVCSSNSSSGAHDRSLNGIIVWHLSLSRKVDRKKQNRKKKWSNTFSICWDVQEAINNMSTTTPLQSIRWIEKCRDDRSFWP